MLWRGGHLCQVTDNTVWSHWQVASHSSELNFTKNYMLLYLFLSCLVSSFNSTIHQAQVPLQIYRCVQFKSVLFYSSRSSMLVVINKITEAWPSTVQHGERSQLLFALHHLPIDSQIFVENHDLCLPTCTWRNRWRGPRRKIAIRFGIQKLECFGYLTVKKVWGYEYPFWQNSQMWQTDTAWRHRLRLYIASHGKNWNDPLSEENIQLLNTSSVLQAARQLTATALPLRCVPMTNVFYTSHSVSVTWKDLLLRPML